MQNQFLRQSILRGEGFSLEGIFGFRYKKAGVMLLDLVPARIVQGDLWTALYSAKSKSLMTAIDIGRGTLTYASSGRQ
jgi:DNA polymerase V